MITIKKRKPRTPRSPSSVLLHMPTDQERAEWEEGRRTRFEAYRRAWISKQPRALVPKTGWFFKTEKGTFVNVDVTEPLLRMVDFVSVITGVQDLIVPYHLEHEDEPLITEILPATFPTDFRVMAELDVYRTFRDSLDRFAYNTEKYPIVVIDCVRRELYAELTRFFNDPEKYSDVVLDEVDDGDGQYFSPPPRYDSIFRNEKKYPALKKWVESIERQEFQMPVMATCPPGYRTAGGNLGRAERRCIVNAICALDGITPSCAEWWQLPKPGSKSYYRYKSSFRFVLFEALLWCSVLKPIQDVTAKDVSHYLKHFARMVGDVRSIYNKLRESDLPTWNALKAEFIDFAKHIRLSSDRLDNRLHT